MLQPKPPLSDSERVSNGSIYPQSICEELDSQLNFSQLDSEGRVLTIDFGLFVLINVYCPNDGTGAEEREKFKMDFHRLLELRVKGLLEEGREVMVLGDINACAAVIDHCEGPLLVSRGQTMGMKDEEGFWGNGFRTWLRNWLAHEDSEGAAHGGPMVDIVRRFWPDRRGMYTCKWLCVGLNLEAHSATGWNTKISARESNYGTRIDYILITKGLVPWIKAADIQQDVKGSDHCPAFVDLHEEITTSNGSVLRLRDLLGARNPDSAPPRLAARFWDEYSGKQTQLHKFFTKKAAVSPSKASSSVLTPDGGTRPSASLDDISEVATQTSSQPQPSLVDQSSQATLDSLINTSALTPVVSQPSPTSTGTSSIPAITNNATSGFVPDRPPKRKLPWEAPPKKAKKQKGKKLQKDAVSQPSPASTGTSSMPATTNNTTSDSVPDRRPKRKLPWETPLEKAKKQKGKQVQKGESTESTSQTSLSSLLAEPTTAVEPEIGPLIVGESTPTASSATKMGKEKDASLLIDIIDAEDCPVDLSLVEDNIPGTEVEDLRRPSSSGPSRSPIRLPSRNGSKHKLKSGNIGNDDGNNGKDAWSAILAPTPIPPCTVHNEPAKEYTVRKPGPNKGKRFFTCSR